MDISLLELFKNELELNSRILEDGLVAIEGNQSSKEVEPLMRAAHSIKGAAKIIGLESLVGLSHSMEDKLVKVMNGNSVLSPAEIELLLKANDIFITLAEHPAEEIEDITGSQSDTISDIQNNILKSDTLPEKKETTEIEKTEVVSQTIEADDETENFSHDIDPTLLELFKTEIETNSEVLENGLVDVESDKSPEAVEPLMRAAHSIKGAARIIGIDSAVQLAHAMEDMLSAAQKGQYNISADDIDLLLKSNDFIKSASELPVDSIPGYFNSQASKMSVTADELRHSLKNPVVVDKSKKSEESPASAPADSTNNPQPKPGPVNDTSLLDLFKIEVENNSQVLEDGLVDVENNQLSETIEPLMRAAHSLKGAARIVGLDNAVTLAHAMEDMLSAAQKGEYLLSSDDIEVLLKSNDMIKGSLETQTSELPIYFWNKYSEVINLKEELKFQPGVEKKIPAPKKNKTVRNEESLTEKKPVSPEKIQETEIVEKSPAIEKKKEIHADQFVRVSSVNLNKLMGLAGESYVQTKSYKPLADNLYAIKDQINELNCLREEIFEKLVIEDLPEEIISKFSDSEKLIERIRTNITNQINNFEIFSRKLDNISGKLYSEAIETRMRPFIEGTHGFPRMVRDIARKLGKKVKFDITGEQTRVDRDILEKIESPLNHLLRNSVDHGIEMPEDRLNKGKDEEGTLTLKAQHRSGMLIVTVQDDGKGIDPEMIRKKVVEKGYNSREMAAQLSNSELMEFLFLPGFSTAGKVTEISGRGVGLDVVFSMVNEVGGTVRADSEPGFGTSFILELPLTLSVVRSLIVSLNNEIYSLPLTRIDNILRVNSNLIKTVEDRQFCEFNGENIGIIKAAQVLNTKESIEKDDYFHIAVISDRLNRYGLNFDKFLGERDLVVIPLNPRLGKIPNISAGAIMEDGTPLLILDVDDLVRSIDKILGSDSINKLESKDDQQLISKKILVVDDSITVREVERRLLENHGYHVTVAVDGMDGWNTVQRMKFDLVISDIDMPRMNGIEFVTKIKNDPNKKNVPVMIVSYKDREEDKIAGLEAGANYYFTKSSFHDETLINAVKELIGDA